MLLRLRDVVNSQAGLGELMSLSPAPIAKVGYTIAWNARKIAEEVKTFNDSRDALIKQYGAQNAEGQMEVLKANIETYQQEINSLLDIEINVELRTIPWVQIVDCEAKRHEFEIPVSALYSCWFMFEEPTEEPKKD